jgi:hypothetical protein
VEELRSAPDQQDGDGEALWEPVAVDPSRPISQTNPPRRAPHHAQTPRATAVEVERRIAEAQLWIAQRLPLVEIRAKAGESWGVNNIKTINRYLDLARMRMVEELISDRRRHQAEQIFALNDCARRAMDAEQFSAAVGAFRVIAEIGGLLRAPIKPPEARP